MKYLFTAVIVMIVVSLMTIPGGQVADAQQPSATPVRVTILTSTPASTAQQLATPTFTWTPPAPTGPQLEALAEAGEVNVRAEPDPSAQRLGTISSGQLYVVRGRYFSWYLFDYPPSPTGTGWVFEQLVTIIGDQASIPETNPYAVPTSAADAAASATLAAILELPGGDATATAASRIIVLPTSTVDFSIPVDPGQSGRATYTPPAEYNLRIMPTATPSDTQGIAAALSNVTSDGVPPIVPIAALGIVGVLGMAIGILRR